MHNRIVEAVGSCLPIHEVVSIDEMTCRLLGDERDPERAGNLARRIKAAIFEWAGEFMRCSIGIAPNALLAKMAADMRKPDGLTILRDGDLPAALHHLQITDFPGIAQRMERRLRLHGISSVPQLCAASVKTLAAVWGSRLLGEKWFWLLRGKDVPDKPTRRQTVGHSHVLPPEFRTDAGAYGVLVRLGQGRGPAAQDRLLGGGSLGWGQLPGRAAGDVPPATPLSTNSESHSSCHNPAVANRPVACGATSTEDSRSACREGEGN